MGVRQASRTLAHSMNLSVDGFIADRDGAIGWPVPSEVFRSVRSVEGDTRLAERPVADEVVAVLAATTPARAAARRSSRRSRT